MLNKINYRSIWMSAIIGIIIGTGIVVFFNDTFDLKNMLVNLIICSIIGLITGAITEIITAMLPITLAKPKLYFFINNLIAVVVTYCILTFLYLSSRVQTLSTTDIYVIIALSTIVIACINGIDYLIYVRTNNKLKAYKLRNRRL